jgi:hypothetical protein
MTKPAIGKAEAGWAFEQVAVVQGKIQPVSSNRGKERREGNDD